MTDLLAALGWEDDGERVQRAAHRLQLTELHEATYGSRYEYFEHGRLAVELRRTYERREDVSGLLERAEALLAAHPGECRYAPKVCFAWVED